MICEACFKTICEIIFAEMAEYRNKGGYGPRPGQDIAEITAARIFSRLKKTRENIETATDKDVLDTYDHFSQSYDEPGNPLIPIDDMIVSSLLRHIEFEDVLDAGCGTGRWALRLAESGKKVVAVDGSKDMLKVAKQKAKEKNLNIDFRHEHVTELSSGSSSFDLVICTLTLAHVRELEKACAEFSRVLRAGGHVIITDIHPDCQALGGEEADFVIENKSFPFPFYHPTVDEYVKAVESAGCELLAAIDAPMEQHLRGFATGLLVVFAQKKQGRV